MAKKKIDLSDIKEYDLDKTASFTDLMTKKERKNRHQGITVDDNDIDIEDMINEKRKSSVPKEETKVEEPKEEIKEKKKESNNKKELVKEIIDDSNTNKSKKKDKEELDDTKNFEKTQILELTRQMKYNFDEKREENSKHKKRWISPINIIGEVNLICIGYYIYLLVFSDYQDIETNYFINGGLIVLLVILFGLSVVTNKKISKVFNIINIIAIFGFIAFNIYLCF